MSMIIKNILLIYRPWFVWNFKEQQIRLNHFF